jgi:dimethylargininase
MPVTIGPARRGVESAATSAAILHLMLAWVREVSPKLAQCELSYLGREAIDAARAVAQHHAYTQVLQDLGCQLRWLAPLPQHPDGVFVEDTAIVLPETAVITRPGAASRRGETASVASALAQQLPLTLIGEPGCLEGGDVLRIGRSLYVGASARSNAAGIAQLAAALAGFGYQVHSVRLCGCLHLKSACTFIPPDTLLLNPQWVEPGSFGRHALIRVDEREPYAANTLTVAGTTLVSAAYPRTHERLGSAGVPTRILEVSELHKAEAALTCLSLLLG